MGAVFILSVRVTSGEIFKSFTLQNFDGVSYYSGTIGMDDLLGRRDHYGFALACLDLNRENTMIELTVGTPGYSNTRGNSRGGAWMTMFLDTLSPPTSFPTLFPTISLNPTSGPSSVPTFEPSLTPMPSVSPSLSGVGDDLVRESISIFNKLTSKTTD